MEEKHFWKRQYIKFIGKYLGTAYLAGVNKLSFKTRLKAGSNPCFFLICPV